MDRWVEKVAVVTGASSGIGAAIAEKLVENGLHVVALARRKDKLDQLAKKFVGKKGPVHILINNAGTGSTGYLTDGESELWNKTVQLNVIGLSIATREAVKDMKANNVDGHIIHINSILGHQIPSIPGLNIYPATKYAVTALAETLRLELNSLKLKIKITSLSPGLVDTEFIPPEIRQMRKKLYEENQIIEPENIADGVIYVLSTPPHVQIQELMIRPLRDHV
ncbi:hypothetical protein NQ314_014550 [Rhamnusium bicolor]|uniref:Farnesol dehydrogenase n=1 Tax=Rhamnusium bicolor TaxID=1586634 RepID=A0AAV8X138_9CUCU|nr:hypothetical protein NQ314_014550 [Rhamnusium bicolor]